MSFDAASIRSQLRQRQRAGLRMQGSSMSPVLPHGCYAHVRPLRRDEDLVGALVALDCDGKVVVHRVFASDRNEVHTHGIAGTKVDAPIQAERVLGVVCGRGRFVGGRTQEPALRAAASAWTRLRRAPRALRLAR